MHFILLCYYFMILLNTLCKSEWVVTTKQNLIINQSNISIACDDNYTVCNITCIECSHSNISCSSSNEHCHINCISNNSCSESLMIAPYTNKPYNVHITCDGYRSCTDSKIIGMNMSRFDTFCDKQSCFNLIGYFDYTHSVHWNCSNRALCHFNYLNVATVSELSLNCNGNNTKPGEEDNTVRISTCFQFTITATQATILNIECINSYSCGMLIIYPAEVQYLKVYSIGYYALYGMDIWYPMNEININMTCSGKQYYSCSHINIYGDNQLMLENTNINCIGTGCGGHWYIESKYGLNDINFTLNSQCYCQSVADCIGDVNNEWNIDELWDIICGSKDCNYSVQILKEPDVDEYSQLNCEIVDDQCSNNQTQSFCNNCSQNIYIYGNQCCGNYIQSLHDSFNYYHNILNCTINPHTADDDDWYYPVAVCLLGFVVICLLLIWLKNYIKQKQNEKYESMIKKRSVNGSSEQQQQQQTTSNLLTSVYSINNPENDDNNNNKNECQVLNQ